jgi:hypothetical protein
LLGTPGCEEQDFVREHERFTEGNRIHARGSGAAASWTAWLTVIASLSASVGCSGGSDEGPFLQAGVGGAVGGGADCPAGEVVCGEFCADLQSSPTDCGACGAACADDQVCVAGRCGSTCETGQTDCDGACVDLDAHVDHCGGCDTACQVGETCTRGRCVGGNASGGTSATGGASASGGTSGAGGAGGTSGAATGGSGASRNSNPDADCAARSLLDYLYEITGTCTLSGQESMSYDTPQAGSFPSSRDAYVQQRTGKFPALYSSDFGDFGESNLQDRQRVVDNVRAYASRGSVIQLHYHMIQPDQPDGSGFETMAGFTADSPYPASNIDRILTVGDSLNTEHLRRLDEIAGYLGQLQDAGIAVLWRPYHEMNGDWFWWGQQARFRELWIQQWERFTNVHHLNNLVWVFSVNHWSSGWGIGPDEYYPGDEYVDVLGVDIYTEYGHTFDTNVHDSLFSLGGGKPIAITENGEMPDIPAIQDAQPSWVYWATWWGFEDAASGNTDADYASVYGAERTLTQDEVDLPGCP